MQTGKTTAMTVLLQHLHWLQFCLAMQTFIGLMELLVLEYHYGFVILELKFLLIVLMY